MRAGEGGGEELQPLQVVLSLEQLPALPEPRPAEVSLARMGLASPTPLRYRPLLGGGEYGKLNDKRRRIEQRRAGSGVVHL